jgi:hypothetical protein
MECELFSSISAMWDSRVAHSPTSCIFNTILTLYMEMDLSELLPHNLEGQGTGLGDTPQNDM